MFGLMLKNVEEVEKVICNGRERGKEGGKGERGRKGKSEQAATVALNTINYSKAV